MPKKKDNKNPPVKAVKKRQPAKEGGSRKTTSKAAAQPAPPPEGQSKPRIFPERFPFWARLKIDKKRTTLVIDESPAIDKKTKKLVDGFVHREATHPNKPSDYEKIYPNPDKDDPEPMYLKRPRKLPQYLFKPHNKDLDMPEDLKKRYENNNNKSDKKE